MSRFFNPKEVIAAAPDAIALSAGGKVARPHPLASELSLRAIADACAVASNPGRALPDSVSTMALGMTTSDFANVIFNGLETVTVAAYHDQAAHLAFAVPQEVKNFNPVSILAVDMDVDLLPLVDIGMELEQFYAVLAGGASQVKLSRFGRVFTLTREAVVNNQMIEFGQLFVASGASTGRLESRLVAAAMESNPTLDDGQVVFGSEFLNVLDGSDGVFSDVALGKAMALLRKQPTASGNRADLPARHLVVEPDLELSALAVLRDIDVDIKVSVLAGLPTGRWYLLADPKLAPTVGVLRLFGAKEPIRIGKPSRPIQKDGVHTGIVADLGACLLRRIGIVRGG